MEIRPIVSALMRSKVALVLIGLQIALTLAIVCNSLFIIGQRLERMNRPSGMNEADTFWFGSTGFGQGFDVKSAQQADLQLLRQMPGVAAATSVNSVPMSDGGWSTGVSLTREQKKENAETAMYFVDDRGLETYGIKLIAGRNFTAEEVTFRTINSRTVPASVIITDALAKKLFPDGDALGKQAWWDDPETSGKSTIVGIVERAQVPWMGASFVEYSTFAPSYIPYGNSTRYLVRAEPGRRDEVMKAVEQKMSEANSSRIIGKMRTIERVRNEAYAEDRAMAIILGTVIFLLLTITALGIVGMASFWVTQRTKQIGTRRALGATKLDILGYFLTENFLITTAGLIVGGVLTYAFSLWLLAHVDGAKLLPWYYVPVGFICLWLLGQLAVLGPATRASRVPPALATRSI